MDRGVDTCIVHCTAVKVFFCEIMQVTNVEFCPDHFRDTHSILRPFFWALMTCSFYCVMCLFMATRGQQKHIVETSSAAGLWTVCVHFHLCCLLAILPQQGNSWIWFSWREEMWVAQLFHNSAAVNSDATLLERLERKSIITKQTLKSTQSCFRSWPAAEAKPRELTAQRSRSSWHPAYWHKWKDCYEKRWEKQTWIYTYAPPCVKLAEPLWNSFLKHLLQHHRVRYSLDKK